MYFQFDFKLDCYSYRDSTLGRVFRRSHEYYSLPLGSARINEQKASIIHLYGIGYCISSAVAATATKLCLIYCVVRP